MVFSLNVSELSITHPVEADVHLVLDLDHIEPLPHSQLPLVGVVIPAGNADGYLVNM